MTDALDRARSLILSAVRLRREARWLGDCGRDVARKWVLGQAGRALDAAMAVLAGEESGEARGCRDVVEDLR